MGFMIVTDGNGNDITAALGLGDISSNELTFLEGASRFRGTRQRTALWKYGHKSTGFVRATTEELAAALVKLRSLRAGGLLVDRRDLFPPFIGG